MAPLEEHGKEMNLKGLSLLSKKLAIQIVQDTPLKSVVKTIPINSV